MRQIILIALLVVGLAIDASITYGASGETLVLPLPRVKVRSGLRLSIDTKWVSGSGYRPVTVKLTPIAGGPAVADRYVDVSIRPHGWYGGEKAGAAMATVFLAQGDTFGEAVVDIPQTNAWSSVTIESYENGRFLSDLSGKRLGLSPRFFNESFDGTPSILVLKPGDPKPADYLLIPIGAPPGTASGITSSGTAVTISEVALSVPSGMAFAVAEDKPYLVVPGGWFPPHPLVSPMIVPVETFEFPEEMNQVPDIRAFASCFPVSFYNGYITPDRIMTGTRVSDAELTRLFNDLPYIALWDAKALPDHWLSYSSIDVIIAPLDQLQRLASSDAARWEALRTWLSSGTTLIVYGVGTDVERLNDLNQLLGLPPISENDGSSGWKPPDANNFASSIKFTGQNQVTNWWQQQAVQQAQVLNRPTPTVDTSRFRIRGVGAGHVVAIAAHDPFPGTEHDWSWIFNSLPPRSWLWQQRNGLSLRENNSLFWNFLLDDIGRAPVFSFLTLITLFAIVIGPVNYFLLRRRGHLYLLLVTVPAGALIVTTTLLLYATFADGLGVRARIRSFTLVDQAESRAVSWSRHMYYAGLAPSRGLVFPTDAAAYPIDYRPRNGFGVEDQDRLLVWGSEQNLAAGYFVSRTASQFMVVEPRQSKIGLRIHDGSEGTPTVTNELGATIHQMLLRDKQGRLYVAASTENGAAARLEQADAVEESARWKGLLAAKRLNFPEGFNVNNLEDVSGIFGSAVFYNNNAPEATLETSLLESFLRDWMSDVEQKLQPGTYIVSMDRPPQVSSGVESAEEKQGFHILVGRW